MATPIRLLSWCLLALVGLVVAMLLLISCAPARSLAPRADVPIEHRFSEGVRCYVWNSEIACLQLR